MASLRRRNANVGTGQEDCYTRKEKKVARDRGPRGRLWCFTSFSDELPEQYDAKVVRYIIYQQEKSPNTQRLHWQGYVEFYDPLRKGQVQAQLDDAGAHVEVIRGSRTQNREYCRKDESAVVPHRRFEFGIWREEVNRKRKLADLLRTNMPLQQLIDEQPHLYVYHHRGLQSLYMNRIKKKAKVFRKMLVLVLLGATGSGKTRTATSGNDWFMMPDGDGFWFDGYAGEKTLIIDDFDGGIKYKSFLRLLDGHAQKVPIKGGFVHAQWENVIITSSSEPHEWYTKGGVGNVTAELARRLTSIVRLDLPVAADATHVISFN